MAGATTCIRTPEVNGQDSKLYRDLLKKQKVGRPMANYLYAAYVVPSSNLAAQMTAAGFKPNAQGQHNAADLLQFLNFAAWRTEVNTIAQIEEQINAVDSNGNRIDYTNAREALEIADNLNDNSKGIVAHVDQHGNIYNIIVSEKNANTHDRATTVKKKLKVWEVCRQAFNTINVDIENFPQEVQDIITAYNIDMVQNLLNLQNRQMDMIFRKEAIILFNMDPNSPEVRRIVTAFGSIEDAAQAIDDINHGNSTFTSAQKLLLKRAVDKCKKMQGLDLTALQTQVAQMSQQVSNASPETDIKAELHRLNKKYHIQFNEIHRTSREINKLSEAVADATVLLERRIRELEQIKGNNAEGKRLEVMLNQLLKELENKRYYSGILHFLTEATAQVSEIDNLLQSFPQTGTELEKAFGAARILRTINTIKEQYYALAEALSNDHLIIDEAISSTDIANMKQAAKQVKEIYDKKSKVIRDREKAVMTDILRLIVGDTAPDGQLISNIVEMADADSSIIDFLYSVGRASNPMVAAMGSIIRKAQDSRDAIMNEFSERIRIETHKLYKAGFTSEFMYEDDGHIISDIDWQAYTSARKQHIKTLYRQGLQGFDLKQAIEDWEDQNTEDRVVDTKSGRTERVPNSLYRKVFPTLAPAQLEYYKNMMQLKGEIGTLLPSYAQHHYLPPQVRRSMLDAIGHSKSAKDVVKAIKNKMENFYKIREDDENYHTNGIIEGEDYQIVNGGYDNTPLRQIPIFFVNKVEQEELLKNFSTGLAALAGTAINYDAMSNIAQVVEFIGDHITSQAARDPQKRADVVGNKMVQVFKDLLKHGDNTNTKALVQGFIDQHIYGIKRDPNENRTWAKIVSNIVGYTSFKGLSTNIKGAVSNYIVGEFQMLIEAGAGEFYGFKDYFWAHKKLFGNSGVGGELAELLTNNINHKGVLLREMFDPINENFSDKSHTKYYKSAFRQLVSHDCSFIGYSSGEYLIHYVNMYAILHKTKVKLTDAQGRSKIINLYDAFELSRKVDGNSKLLLKQGVTLLDGTAITREWLEGIRNRIKYANQTTHGSMNEEDKGLIHRYWWGRAVMNFRQWMVEHYSRRFRKRHFDASLGMEREGYWVSLWKGLWNDDTKDTWQQGHKKDAIIMFMKDFYTFMFRAQTQWKNLDEMQKYNVKRVKTEMEMYIALLGLSFALGEPDEHKKEFWRRWWIYQVKRLMVDTEASMPLPQAVFSGMTILQSPMAGINTFNSLLYTFYGLYNGDLWTTIQSGPHKGENKYWRNIKKYTLPFFKDVEQMQRMDTDDSIFRVFETTPSRV